MNSVRTRERASASSLASRLGIHLALLCAQLVAPLALLLAAAPAPRALACGTPPPGDCTLTTVIIIIVPRVIITPPNGAVVVPITVSVFIGGTNGMAGAPCPSRGSTDVVLNIVCSPGPSPAPPTAVSLPPISGVYTMAIPVTFTSGPPRTCTITGTATTHYTSPPGMTVVGTNTSTVCIVDPAPNNPAIPRLNLELLTTPVQTAHPGDQRTHVYRVTNNDPTNSVTGVLSTSSDQSGRMSAMTPPPAPGTNPVPGSSASPVSGDAFPIEYAETGLGALPPGDSYIIDDGSAEAAYGPAAPSALIWLNDFTVLPAAPVIDRIGVAFGAGTPDGERVTLALWRDPNNDGNPTDAVLLTTLDVGAINAGTGIINEYPIPPTVTGPVGSHFFVGAMIQSTMSPPQTPGAVDLSVDGGRSWFAQSGPCAGNLNSLAANTTPPMHASAAGFPGNWLIRAHGSSSAAFRSCVHRGDPGAASLLTLTRSITLCPGESKLVKINQRSFAMCRSGSCSHVTTSFAGMFTDSTPALGCAGAGMMIDSSIAPDFRCPDGGEMTSASPTGSPGQVHYTGTMPTHALDERLGLVSAQIIANQLPLPTLLPPLSGVTDSDLPGHNCGRITLPAVFSVPVNTANPVFVTLTLETLPLVPGQSGTILGLDVHPGEPTLGNSYFFVNEHTMLTGGTIPPTLNSFFDVFTTVSLDGIDVGGSHHKFQVNPAMINVMATSTTQYMIQFAGAWPIDPTLPLPIMQARLSIDGIGTASGLQQSVKCPLILVSPVATTANTTSTLHMSVVADGDGPLSYVWRRNTIPLSDNGHVSGSQSPDLTITNLALGDAGSYDCLVSNPCGPATSTPAALTVFCRADYNHSGTVSIQDLFDFLVGYFNHDPRADFNGNGSVTIQDLFDFLGAYFAHC